MHEEVEMAPMAKKLSQVNAGIALAGAGMSLMLHNFFYESDRQWFTRHRIAPGTGIIAMALGTVINRGILRAETKNHNERVEMSFDILAVLMALTSFAVGVLVADLIREWKK